MPAPPVVHELPMRWADLDVLNHVNNVAYLDYAAESRAMLVEDGLVGADKDVARIAVDFRRPLLPTDRPVHVVSTPQDDQLVQEVRTAGSDTIFAQVVTTFGPRPGLEPQPMTGTRYPLRVRRSDVDITGHASLTRVFEFFQEARIWLFVSLLRDLALAPARFVVGRADVTYGEPLSWRREAYPVSARVSRIGERAVTIEAEIADGGVVHARSTTVLVGFDPEAQGSRRLSDREREALALFLVPG